MKKTIKYMIFSCLLLMIVGFNNDVYALDYDYGLYCSYGDYYFIYSGGHKEDKFNVDTNFDELGINIEADRPGKIFSNTDEQAWLKSKGLIDENGNFSCPTNPFNSTLGSAIEKECGITGCAVSSVETSYTSYTCTYIGQTTGKQIVMSYLSSAEYVNGKWDITYPDGTSKTFVGTEINGNFMPNSDCEDIYYIESEKRIKVAIDSNDEVTNNATLSGLCDTYNQYEIEHFCSGTCTYPEMNCPSDNVGSVFETDGYGCPKALRPIIWFIKKLVFNTLQIFIPIVLILMGTIDLIKATISSDDKGNKDAISKFIKRVLAAVFMFFIVTIVTVVMNMFTKTDVGEQNDWKACWHSID